MSGSLRTKPVCRLKLFQKKVNNMYYFYCPNCGKEEEVSKLPEGTVCNIRDGFGMPINHYECPNCNNLDAGFMGERVGDDNEKKYYQYVIGIYQNIRGFNKNGHNKKIMLDKF